VEGEEVEGLRGQVKSLSEAVVALEGRLRDSEKKFRHDKRYGPTHTPHTQTRTHRGHTYAGPTGKRGGADGSALL
jgi:hypothetical protein